MTALLWFTLLVAQPDPNQLCWVRPAPMSTIAPPLMQWHADTFSFTLVLEPSIVEVSAATLPWYQVAQWRVAPAKTYTADQTSLKTDQALLTTDRTDPNL